MEKKLRIVFMGTPEFAVPSLRALLDEGYPVVGVFTQPDRPAGRGKKLVMSPVKELAMARSVEVFQFERIKRQEGLNALRALKPDLCVTAAFGQILSQKNLDVPPLGTVNVHASLLPKYRGAAPINWCIMMGETVTGVTTMYTDAGVDTGDIIDQMETPIGPHETAGELTERLSLLGAELLIKTLRAIERGTAARTPQNPDEATHQPMLDKRMGAIDFSRGAEEISCQVRGLNPWPGAYAQLAGERLKVWTARPAQWDGEMQAPGTILAADPKRGLIAQCGAGAIEFTQIQAQNARRMDARAYLAGKSMEVGARFESEQYEGKCEK